MQFDKGVFFGYTIIMSGKEKQNIKAQSSQKSSSQKGEAAFLEPLLNNQNEQNNQEIKLKTKENIDKDKKSETNSQNLKKSRKRLTKKENLEEAVSQNEKEQLEEKQPQKENHQETQFQEEPDTALEKGSKKTDKENQDGEKEKLDEQKRKLDEAEQSVAKQNSKKKKLLNLGFFFLNIAIVVGILIYQLNGQKFELIHGLKLNGWAIILMLLFFGVTLFFDTFTISYLLRISTGKWRFGLSYKVFAIGRYYDNITPLATGGQPFQITYLKNRGVPLHTALSVPMAKYLFQQIAWVSVGLVCLIISSVDKTYNTFVSIASIIGFLLGFVMLAAVLFLCVCKTFGRKLVVKILRLLYKMKIIKNYDKQYAKITKYIEDFQSVMQQYAKSPKDFLIMTAVSIIKLLSCYSIPYFIYSMMMGFSADLYVKFTVMSLLVDMASSFFPLPGGTGMNEISFSAMFAPLFPDKLMTFWALLIWRFCTYYYSLIQGICCISYDVAYGNRKYRWQTKKDMLIEESKVFKQAQIDKFRLERSKRRYTSRKKRA